MVDVLILAEVESQAGQFFPGSVELGIMVDALRQAIIPLGVSSSPGQNAVHVASPSQIPDLKPGTIICPLTLAVPTDLQFPGRTIYTLCRDVEGLRQWVQHHWGGLTGEGELWLPIALTAKGPLYGEVIGSDLVSIEAQPDAVKRSYYQPLHLSDRLRQPLYRLGSTLLRSHLAPPAVYLLQFGIHDTEVCFDRLLPFPAAPAIASIGVQTPNLFTCHWRCMTGQPLQDLAIPGSVPYWVWG